MTGSGDDTGGGGYSYCGEDSTRIVSCTFSSRSLAVAFEALTSFFRGGIVALDSKKIKKKKDSEKLEEKRGYFAPASVLNRDY